MKCEGCERRAVWCAAATVSIKPIDALVAPAETAERERDSAREGERRAREALRRLQEASDHVVMCWRMEQETVWLLTSMDSFVNDLRCEMSAEECGATLYCALSSIPAPEGQTRERCDTCRDESCPSNGEHRAPIEGTTCWRSRTPSPTRDEEGKTGEEVAQIARIIYHETRYLDMDAARRAARAVLARLPSRAAVRHEALVDAIRAVETECERTYGVPQRKDLIAAIRALDRRKEDT